MSSHLFLRYARQLHLYLGVFTAPALIFFAFTGALQTFSLHETTHGSSYKHPAWAVTLAQLHKKQTPVLTKKPVLLTQAENPFAKKADPPPAPAAPPAAKQHHPLPMKIFFLVVAIGLLLSTISGIYMSYRYLRNRRLVTAFLILGAVIPVALSFV
jgi:uncharacterized iron-regulated membrane protein